MGHSPFGGPGAPLLTDRRVLAAAAANNLRPAAMVVRWAVQAGVVAALLPKTTSQLRLEANLGAPAMAPLPAETMAALAAMDPEVPARDTPKAAAVGAAVVKHEPAGLAPSEPAPASEAVVAAAGQTGVAALLEVVERVAGTQSGAAADVAALEAAVAELDAKKLAAFAANDFAALPLLQAQIDRLVLKGAGASGGGSGGGSGSGGCAWFANIEPAEMLGAPPPQPIRPIMGR